MKVAVIGGGISGLTAAWLLNEHSENEVDLIEANGYVGGHTNTVEFRGSPSSDAVTNVDTGFMVFNELTYPNFVQFLKFLKIDYVNSDMSFSIKRASSSPYEWSASGIKSLFVGTSSWTDRLNQFRLVWDIARFNCSAPDALSSEVDRELTVGEYLSKNGYSEVFQQNYLLPMIASVWATPANKTALAFPMQTLIRFMSNHHLLQITNQPQWLTIKNGSKAYVDRILSQLDPANRYTNTPVDSISFAESGKKIYLNTGSTQSAMGPYDQVIFACHANQAADIIRRSACGDLLDDELNILSQFEFSKNQAVLHSDTSVMPQNKEVWTARNYLVTGSPSSKEAINAKDEISQSLDNVENTVSLTYCMNQLQSIPQSKFGPVLLTLNPARPIDSKYVSGTWDYSHWLYTAESFKAQKSLQSIQAKNRLSFVGAWTNDGFHEDGFTSALKLLTRDRSEIFGITKSPIEMKQPKKEVDQTYITSLIKILFQVSNYLILVLEMVMINMFYHFTSPDRKIATLQDL